MNESEAAGSKSRRFAAFIPNALWRANMDDIEKLRERNERLETLCQTMATLLDGMMQASAKDNPELLTLPHFVEGQKMFARLSLELREIKGEA